MRQLHKKPSSHIEMRGFEYLVYSAFSLCLLVVLVLLPLSPVFAAEEIIAETTPPESSAPVEEVVPEDTDLGSQITPEDTEESAVGPTSEDFAATELAVSIAEESLPAEPTSLIAETEEGASSVELEVPEILDPVAENETNTTPEDSANEEEDPLVTNDESNDDVQDVVVVHTDEGDTSNGDGDTENFETGTTTEDAEQVTVEMPVGETVLANTVTTDENRFTFAKGECTSVGDEMFYCAKPVGPVTAAIQTDRIFAAVDADGDKEIYIEKGGEVTALTQNLMDDDAPYFDAVSNTFVWHRLIDGRYQIISYDVETEEETQLTHDRYNNMSPSRYGDVTVWQGWVGNDWEIFLLDGDELTMLTDNTTHDITPSVNGTHSIWQSFEAGVWQMKVYDNRTKQINTIENTDGGSVQNPRMVLVYDTKFESGDVETRGYDLVSGKIIPLGSAPAPMPSHIPDPDQTGEKSALVSPQTQLRSKVDGGDDISGAGGTGDTAPDAESDDLVVPPHTSTTTDTVQLDADSSETDVVVPDVVVENASSTTHIHDLIITPYTEPIETDLSSPQEVASST